MGDNNTSDLQSQNLPANQTQQQSNITVYSGGNYIKNHFLQDIQTFRGYINRKTGYSNLDAVQPLYPGLYVLGAISSLGKTTFAGQMADQIASAGTPVLYFSLEQSALELYSKSISRKIYQHSLSDPSYQTFSSIDIRRGKADGTRELQEQMDDYVQTIKDNIWIIECNFAVTVEDIIDYITKFIQQFKAQPVVIIDYLQIIAPSSVNGKLLDGRASIDHAVHTLKSFQSIHQMTIFAICSLNRQNYTTPIDFEAFKESGGIEYTADAVWGLQLQCIHDEIFGKEGKVKEKRERIQKEKSQIPRHLELTVLKNRYGRTNYSLEFEYHPVFDTFTPITYGNFTSIKDVMQNVDFSEDTASQKSLDGFWQSDDDTPTPFD